MPLDTKPEDKPAAVRFHLIENAGAFEITCASLEQKTEAPFHVHSNSIRFENREAFKARAVEVGMTPAVAEDASRSFNATARQLTEMGFQVQLPEEVEKKNDKAA